jgi:hypothetical protein
MATFKSEILIDQTKAIEIEQRTNKEYKTIFEMGECGMMLKEACVREDAIDEIDEKKKEEAGEEIIRKSLSLSTGQQKNDQ